MKCLVYFISLIGICLATGDAIDQQQIQVTTPKPAPKTTTQKTTTEPITTTTSTTTTAAPTTVKPTPAPGPQTGNWTWTDSNSNTTCVMVQMAAQFNITYLDKDNHTVSSLVNVPTDASTVAGSCVESTQYIGLSWPSKLQKQSHSLTLTFMENSTTKLFTLSNIAFSMPGDLPNSGLDSLDFYYAGSDIYAPVAMSYHCTRQQKFNMTEKRTNLISTIELSHLQVEAFHKDNSKAFSEARDCDSIDTPDIVPIAVGCALAALVIIVLIAYLVGRRRSQARGYLSM